MYQFTTYRLVGGRLSFNFVHVKADVPPIVRMNRHHFTPSFYTPCKEIDVREKWADTTLYKLPLDRRIDQRIRAPPKPEDLQQKLRSYIKKTKLNDLEVLRSPINLNHWVKES